MAENDSHYNGTPDTMNMEDMENIGNMGSMANMDGMTNMDGMGNAGSMANMDSMGNMANMDGMANTGSMTNMDSMANMGNMTNTGSTANMGNAETMSDTDNRNGTNARTAEQEQGSAFAMPDSGESNAAFRNPTGRSVTAPVISLPFPGSGWQIYPGSSTGNSNNTGSSANGTAAFPWFPTYPSCPSCGSVNSQNYGQVRFLNASTNSLTVNISVDGTVYASNSRFATLSNYDWISDGFHTVTVRRANGLRSTLLQQTFPFASGQKVTMVLTDSPEGGLELIRVIDSGCSNLPSNSGCFRFANMTYSGSNLDLLLSGQTIFRNVRYQNVTSYKQAVAGTYQFTVVTASSYSFIRELPIIVIGAIGTLPGNRETLLTFTANIRAGRNYTAYLIGNTWSNANLQVILASD